MAKEPRSERWQYQPDAVARQPELAADNAPPPGSPSRAGVARDGVEPVLAFPDPALTEIARAARSELHASAVAIAVDTGAGMICRARAGESAPDLGATVDRQHGMTGECVSTGSVVRCANTAHHPKVDPAFSERLGVRSVLAAPLLHGSAVVGVIVVFFPMRHAYTDAAVTRLEEFTREAVARVFGGAQVATPAADRPMIPEPLTRPGAVQEPADVAERPATTDEVVSVEEEPALEFLPPRIRRTFPWIAAGVAVSIMATALVLLSEAGGNRARRPATAPIEKTRTAAAAGDLTAEYALAHAYRDGAGVSADAAEANKWLRRAAQGGNPDAQLELATMLEHDPQVPPVEAYTWYVIAWQVGKPEAQSAIQRLTPKLSQPEIAQVRYDVAREYALGRALPRDGISAYVWYSLADAAGDTRARDRLKEIEAQLTPTQLAEAKSRTATWTRRHTAAATSPR